MRRLAHGVLLVLLLAPLLAAGSTPRFVEHPGSRLRTLSDTYKRYLENFFRKRFKLVGTPVRFVFKEGDNPYKDKKNVLSDRQIAKRKRLIRHVKGK